ncbi:MAG: hypothetical protein ACREYF_03170 [Gammaproteobacteria bacterium]
MPIWTWRVASRSFHRLIICQPAAHRHPHRHAGETARHRGEGRARHGEASTLEATYTELLYALMAEAKKKGWAVISMKNDWKRIFAFE